MTFNVGDKVRIVDTEGYKMVSIGQVAVVTWVGGGSSVCLMRGSCEEHSSLDSENWHYCFPDCCCVPYQEPTATPPRKMHPDDFIQSVNDLALDNGFSVDTMAIKTHGGATVYYTNPQPAN